MRLSCSTTASNSHSSEDPRIRLRRLTARAWLGTLREGGLAVEYRESESGHHIDPRELPVGLELDGPSGSDRKLLAIGMALDKVFGRLPAPPAH